MSSLLWFKRYQQNSALNAELPMMLLFACRCSGAEFSCTLTSPPYMSSGKHHLKRNLSLPTFKTSIWIQELSVVVTVHSLCRVTNSSLLFFQGTGGISMGRRVKGNLFPPSPVAWAYIWVQPINCNYLQIYAEIKLVHWFNLFFNWLNFN